MKITPIAVLGFAAGFVSGMVTSPGKSAPGTSPACDPSPGPRRKRHARDLRNLPRSAALSQLFSAAEHVAPPNYPPEALFAPSALVTWFKKYVSYVLRRKHPFPPYTKSPRHAVYDLLDENGADNVRIALAGDWGTGTAEAEKVAGQMEAFRPHFTIHIGDIYYVGDPVEVRENCLGIRNPNNNYDPLKWPLGSRGSFALNGNHEMYAKGWGYFDVFLPHLGLRVDGKMMGQHTSFFCLQNNFWRIIAIDTGYNSVGLPILEQIPLVNRIPGVGPDCRLPAPLIDWLAEVVLAEPDNRGIIVMSHHQYHSGFDEEFHVPAEQLWDVGIRRPVLWFWGHEHRLAGYDLRGEGSLQAFGRCVGHGAMPLEPTAPRAGRTTPQFYDARPGECNFGVNGHVNLAFSGPTLTASYLDLDGAPILRETWSKDASGAVRLDSQEKLISDSHFHVRPVAERE